MINTWAGFIIFDPGEHCFAHPRIPAQGSSWPPHSAELEFGSRLGLENQRRKPDAATTHFVAFWQNPPLVAGPPRWQAC